MVGRSASSIGVRYTLPTRASGNSATQTGGTTLVASQDAVLVDITQSGGKDWLGMLTVSPDDVPAYRVTLTR